MRVTPNQLIVAFTFLSVISGTACRTRTFNPASLAGKKDKQADDKGGNYVVLDTGAATTVVYHWHPGDYRGKSVMDDPQGYIKEKADWGWKRNESVDTDTKAGAGIYTAADVTCAKQWGGPLWTSLPAREVKRKGDASDDRVLFVLEIAPGTRALKPVAGGEDAMEGAIESDYPIIVGGACSSFVIRKTDVIVSQEAFPLGKKEWTPTPVGSIEIPEAALRSERPVEMLRHLLRNWHLVEHFGAGAGGLYHVVGGDADAYASLLDPKNPNSAQNETFLLASMAVAEMKHLFPKYMAALEAKLSRLKAKGAESDSGEIKLLTSCVREKSCFYVTVPETTPIGRGALGIGSPAPELLITSFNELEGTLGMKFPPSTKERIAALKAGSLTPEQTRSLYADIHAAIVSQWWSPAELVNARRYLELTKAFHSLNGRKATNYVATEVKRTNSTAYEKK